MVLKSIWNKHEYKNCIWKNLTRFKQVWVILCHFVHSFVDPKANFVFAFYQHIFHVYLCNAFHNISFQSSFTEELEANKSKEKC